MIVIAARAESSLEETLSECRGMSADVEDPLYGCQWHLKNTGQFIYSGKEITAGEDINIEGVWNEDVYGTGINVAIVSDGIDLSHEDLSANVRSGPNYSYSERNNSEENSSEKDSSERDDLSDGSSFTGTRAAGVIAATGYNGLGVRGTAPGASIYSYRLSGDLREADAVVRNKEITAVSVNGLGSEDGAFFQEASTSWEEGVELGISKGFYGKGVFYVWGAGDGHERGDQANFSEYSNYYGVTAVCSTDGFGKKSIFSEEGVNLWVCAPGSDIVTTDNKNDYVVTSGTFLSASQVGGVAALLREINGNLSWRDIKLILAGSARQNDFFDPSWETGAVKYGSDTERYNSNPKYGFGVVDAEAAAELAKSWKGVGEMRTITASSDNELTIPDGDGEADGVLVSRLMIPDLEEVTFTEFVEAELVLSCDCLQDLNIQITSPSGTVSELVREVVRGSSNEEENCVSYLRRTHRFGSARHLGEDPSGEWILHITDTAYGDEENEENTVTLHSWSVKVYGHFYQGSGSEITPKALTFGGATIPTQNYFVGEAITPVMLPEATGASDITYSFNPALARGLEFDQDTRTISGTPAITHVSGRLYSYVARGGGRIVTIPFTIRISPRRVPTFGNQTVENQVFVNGSAVTLTLPQATGGNGTLNYSLTNSIGDPIKINGLDYNENTRTLSGTLNVSPSGLPITQTYTYKVTDDDGDSDSITFSITITDLAFEHYPLTHLIFVAGRQVTPQVELPEATGGTAPLTYSLTPDLPLGLSFNEVTRVISGTPTIGISDTDYTYTVTDADGTTVEFTFIVQIRASFDNVTINNKVYIVGTAVTEVLPEAIGHNETVTTYGLTPTLPAGLDFNTATREIRGTPTTATSETMYTYRVDDGNGFTNDDLTFSITVRDATVPTFSGETIDDQEHTAGVQITPVTLPEATSGDAPLTYRLTPALPDGLIYNNITGVISGTPTAAMSETMYTYTVTDNDGDTDELTFNIEVAASFSNVTIEDKVYIAGTAVTEMLPEATGHNGTVTYSLTPSLPAGLDFNTATREISGTPSAATSQTTYTYTVTTGAGGPARTLTFRITIEEDSEPDFSVTTIEDQVYMGRSIRLPVATGGNAPLVYSITPPLPPRLRLDRNTGVISGTPASASSERTYTYTVTDRDGDMKELTFRFSAAAPPPTGSDPGGGGGGCAVSEQSSVDEDILGVMACLMLIPVSVVIRRKRRAQIKM